MSGSMRIEALLERDRVIAIVALVVVIGASWAYILTGAGTGMTAFSMTGLDLGTYPMAPAPWSAGHAVVMFFMWWIMMVAMMLPSAAPMILLHAKVARGQRRTSSSATPVTSFTMGYLAAWAGFSFAAVVAQWALEESELLSGMMASTNSAFGGGLLVAAGLWQLTPLKHACLRHCRSPIGFLSSRWRSGSLGALRMGIEHGIYCVGCCWFLMALLFYGGVMNLYWIIGLAVFVLFEKIAPAGHWFGRAGGWMLLAWGGLVLSGAI